MLNKIWCFMVLFGVIYGIITGRSEAVTNAVIGGGKDAVTLSISMVGVVAVWTGIMKIGEEAGIIDAITKKIEPLMNFLFPEIKNKKKAKNYIATNMVANFLGLGWAATPAGLLAMKELQIINRDKSTASNSMCMFMIINMSSVQLITVNVLAYRLQYGSMNPAEIIGAGIIATIFSTLAGIIFGKIMGGIRRL